MKCSLIILKPIQLIFYEPTVTIDIIFCGLYGREKAHRKYGYSVACIVLLGHVAR